MLARAVSRPVTEEMVTTVDAAASALASASNTFVPDTISDPPNRTAVAYAEGALNSRTGRGSQGKNDFRGRRYIAAGHCKINPASCTE